MCMISSKMKGGTMAMPKTPYLVTSSLNLSWSLPSEYSESLKEHLTYQNHGKHACSNSLIKR